MDALSAFLAVYVASHLCFPTFCCSHPIQTGLGGGGSHMASGRGWKLFFFGHWILRLHLCAKSGRTEVNTNGMDALSAFLAVYVASHLCFPIFSCSHPIQTGGGGSRMVSGRGWKLFFWHWFLCASTVMLSYPGRSCGPTRRATIKILVSTLSNQALSASFALRLLVFCHYGESNSNHQESHSSRNFHCLRFVSCFDLCG
ncbi:hypothetical protein K438DRAFT_551877 [Mycena galopus ATCC 62051]|nr:hypothetical protein K438DRAFT_551877 [Mycena galopus ATCC 62051]